MKVIRLEKRRLDSPTEDDPGLCLRILRRDSAGKYLSGKDIPVLRIISNSSKSSYRPHVELDVSGKFVEVTWPAVPPCVAEPAVYKRHYTFPFDAIGAKIYSEIESRIESRKDPFYLDDLEFHTWTVLLYEEYYIRFLSYVPPQLQFGKYLKTIFQDPAIPQHRKDDLALSLMGHEKRNALEQKYKMEGLPWDEKSRINRQLYAYSFEYSSLRPARFMEDLTCEECAAHVIDFLSREDSVAFLAPFDENRNALVLGYDYLGLFEERKLSGANWIDLEYILDDRYRHPPVPNDVKNAVRHTFDFLDRRFPKKKATIEERRDLVDQRFLRGCSASGLPLSEWKGGTLYAYFVGYWNVAPMIARLTALKCLAPWRKFWIRDVEALQWPADRDEEDWRMAKHAVRVLHQRLTDVTPIDDLWQFVRFVLTSEKYGGGCSANR
jgi:hypothetical protein